MTAIAGILREHPELAIFLALAAGFSLGQIRIGKFKFGPVIGTLIAGMAIGQIGVQVPGTVKIIFFNFFLFATGYRVGPQFFRVFKKDALPQLSLTLVICCSFLASAFFISRLLGFDAGTAAGILAGASTQSTLMGTASEAISHLPVTPGQKALLINNISVAFTITYLIGAVSLLWFLPVIAPRILKINLRDACRDLSIRLTGRAETEPGVDSAFQEWSVRAFRVTKEDWIGKTISEAENSIPETRFFIERIRRENQLIEPSPELVIQPGDLIAVLARNWFMLNRVKDIGTEVFDKDLLDFPLAFREITITNKQVADKTLMTLSRHGGHGIVLRKLLRGGMEMPFSPETIVNLGDVLQVSGRLADIERTARQVGKLEPVSLMTDMIFIGTGVFLGGLLGLLAVNVGSIALTLTTGGGTLVMGLIFGWLHSKFRAVGRIPDAALWVFDNVGLTVFISVVALSIGPGFISGLKETGSGIFLAAVLVSLLPHLAGLLFGRYILKMDPIILLGAQAGAGTFTSGLKAIQDAAGSNLPVLGYSIPYALGNIIAAAWGPVIVALMSWGT